jgi:hypothetical protein
MDHDGKSERRAERWQLLPPPPAGAMRKLEGNGSFDWEEEEEVPPSRGPPRW